jgi:phosphate-selective porin OprO/OprP
MRTLGNILLLSLVCSLPFFSAKADDSKKFKVSPTGRALFDAAAYLPQDDDFKPGVAVPDVRLGAKATFGDFEARADVSYRFGKLYPADIYLQWNINDKSFLKGGFFVHQFGLQSATGASDKISMEEPIAQTAFGENRLLGAMYVYRNKAIHFAGSLYAQSDAMTKHANELGRTGVGALARFAWHPMTESGNIFQIGTSALIQTAAFNGDTGNPVSVFKAQFPTKVSDVNCISASVDHVKSIFKISPEVLWSKGRVAAEGQFYYLNTARKDGLGSFDGLGCYVMTRVLLNRGAKYSYSPWTGYLAIPSAKSLELVAGYSYADLNDSGVGIFGGKANSASLTFNYYIHKYVTWRVNYSYTNRPEAPGLPARHANIFQTRIQFLF